MKVDLRFAVINIFDPTSRFQISAFPSFSLDNRIQVCIFQNLTNLYHLYCSNSRTVLYHNYNNETVSIIGQNRNNIIF